jgi:hypothetical protein
LRTTIETREQFDRHLPDAIERMKELTSTEADPVLFAVLRQLQAIAEWTADGQTLTREQKARIVMGLQASREMATFPVEQDLVCALHSYIEGEMPTRST